MHEPRQDNVEVPGQNRRLKRVLQLEQAPHKATYKRLHQYAYASNTWMRDHRSSRKEAGHIPKAMPRCQEMECVLGGLYQLVLALYGLCEGLQAISIRMKAQESQADMDAIMKLTKHLLGDTKKLSNHFKASYAVEGEHRLETLPTLAMNAGDLTSIQVSSGLAKISTDLFLYQHHFDWLKQAVHVVRPLEPEFNSVHNSIDKLLRRLEHLMARLNLVRASEPLPPLLPTSGTDWSVGQSGHAIFHHFHLFLDWAARALVVIRKKL
ncbi:interleukin-11 [Rhinatrema bivittatum]|uniref:interleukin-11 n=1 Tax=Rhinatrema bivittatum TaxID=194408 RepID=UPI001126B423|nr:interleukin-11 [Rhinatrema bivittatum]